MSNSLDLDQDQYNCLPRLSAATTKIPLAIGFFFLKIVPFHLTKQNDVNYLFVGKKVLLMARCVINWLSSRLSTGTPHSCHALPVQ